MFVLKGALGRLYEGPRGLQFVSVLSTSCTSMDIDRTRLRSSSAHLILYAYICSLGS